MTILRDYSEYLTNLFKLTYYVVPQLTKSFCHFQYSLLLNMILKIDNSEFSLRLVVVYKFPSTLIL